MPWPTVFSYFSVKSYSEVQRDKAYGVFPQLPESPKQMSWDRGIQSLLGRAAPEQGRNQNPVLSTGSPDSSPASVPHQQGSSFPAFDVTGICLLWIGKSGKSSVSMRLPISVPQPRQL